MAKISRAAGATSNVLTLFIKDSSVTTGAGLTGLAFGTPGLTCYYKRDAGTASVAVTLADVTTLGTYVSGGFKAVDGTNMPGTYEFHPPDAALASGSKSVAFLLKGAANMTPLPIEVDLDSQVDVKLVNGSAASVVSGAVDSNLVSVNGTTFSGANVPGDLQTIKTQAVTAAAGVTFPTSLASPTNITAGTITTATNVTTVNGLAANVITAASIASDADTEIASAVWDLATSGHTTSGTFGAAMGAAGSAGDPWSTSLPGSYGSGTAGNIVGTNLNATITSRLAPTVASRTLDVSATGEAGVDWANVGSPTTTVGLTGTTVSTSQVVASVTGAVGSVTGAMGITSNIKKNQALTAFPFTMRDSNKVLTAGFTVTATRSLDGGAFAACANTATSVGNGAYKINLASTDTNANTIMLRFSASGAEDTMIGVVTQP